MQDSMKRCIFCEKTDADFGNDNCWTEEHIIPEALGNKTLKIFNVCKQCNSGLGTYVDNYFVNSMMVKMLRQTLGIKGKNSEIPNAFKEGRTSDGRIIRTDKHFRPVAVQHIEENGNQLRISAPTIEDAKKIIKKKLLRKGFSQKDIDTILAKTVIQKNRYQSVVEFPFEIKVNDFLLEPLKIAFEYAVYKLGSEYLKDERAVEIQQYLKRAINGELKESCTSFFGIAMLDSRISNIVRLTDDPKHHLLIIGSDINNQLVALIILFMNPALSFQVLLSKEADKIMRPSNFQEVEIIEVKS